ncbi:MAG: hypothetical protein IJW55_09475 [Clostridia bacterium]|nr:hypothetical protein [Clostridia bacterium]
MFWIILIVIAVILLICWLKSYKLDIYRNMTAYTGGVGAGKTCLATRQAILCYKRALRAWKWECFKARILFQTPPEMPLLCSNIPILYKKKLTPEYHHAVGEWKKACKQARKEGREVPKMEEYTQAVPEYSAKFSSCQLTAEILFLQERIPESSVVVVDEVSSFLNQFEYNKNVNVNLYDEFCRFCRQYFNGNVIVTDQCISNVILQIRRRLNTVYNLSKHGYFCKINTVKVREINISDEIVTVDQKDTNEQFQRYIWFGNWFKNYASRCFRYRYAMLPEHQPTFHTSIYTKTILKCPDKEYKSLIDETIEKGSAKPKENKIKIIDRSE